MMKRPDEAALSARALAIYGDFAEEDPRVGLAVLGVVISQLLARVPAASRRRLLVSWTANLWEGLGYWPGKPDVLSDSDEEECR